MLPEDRIILLSKDKIHFKDELTFNSDHLIDTDMGKKG